jgi:hypothetical protein
VQAQVAEPHLDQRAHRPRHESAALLGGGDPVPDLSPNAERVPSQTDAAGVPPVDEDPAPVERSLVVHHALEPPPLVVDRAGRVHPRHPGLETSSLDLDQRPDLVQVRDREPPQDGAVAQIGGQGVHEVGVAAF